MKYNRIGMSNASSIKCLSLAMSMDGRQGPPLSLKYLAEFDPVQDAPLTEFVSARCDIQKSRGQLLDEALLGVRFQAAHHTV